MHIFKVIIIFIIFVIIHTTEADNHVLALPVYHVPHSPRPRLYLILKIYLLVDDVSESDAIDDDVNDTCA